MPNLPNQAEPIICNEMTFVSSHFGVDTPMTNNRPSGQDNPNPQDSHWKPITNNSRHGNQQDCNCNDGPLIPPTINYHQEPDYSPSGQEHRYAPEPGFVHPMAIMPVLQPQYQPAGQQQQQQQQQPQQTYLGQSVLNADDDDALTIPTIDWVQNSREQQSTLRSQPSGQHQPGYGQPVQNQPSGQPVDDDPPLVAPRMTY